VPESVAATSSSNESLALLWLALSLTEGLGPKRGQSLVEDLGGIQNVFKASLTELEAAGIRAVSAQSLAIGQSADLARTNWRALPQPEFQWSASMIPLIRRS
jgi:predicted Rossmann fold nucleotide-binding protein DprA/Smf involved in DNA uptake